MTEDKFWNRKYLFISASISAAVNFLSSIIIVKAIGFEYFGIWLTLRSVIQVSSILNFGVSNYLLLLNPNTDEAKIKLTNGIATFISLPYLALVYVIYLIYFDNTISNSLILPFLSFAYWFFSCFCSSIIIFIG